jgi:hypothetical protein
VRRNRGSNGGRRMSRRGGGGGCQFGTTKKGKRGEAKGNATLSSKGGEGDNFFFAFPLKN